MSGSLKIGDDVQAETRKIVGKRDFTQLTGNANYPDTLSGTVMGKGKGQKWEVRWRLSDQQTLNSEHGARVFAKKVRASVQKSAIQQIASDNSDMSISDDSHSYIVINQAQRPTSVGQRPLDILLVQKSVQHKLRK